MKALRNYLDKIKPNFEEGGKFHAFRSVFDGFETFLFVPNTNAKSGTHIHDSIDSKRIMSMVVIALKPSNTERNAWNLPPSSKFGFILSR